MDSPNSQEAAEQRRLRNLQIIARHHATGGPVAPAESGAGPGSASSKQPSPWMKRLGAMGPIGVALLFVFGKLKFIVPLLKLTKLSTLLTMLVSVWAYGLIWGLPFAAGFVMLIYVHEMGHAIVMRQQGIRAGAPLFIPFVGAVIAMKSYPRDAWVEALVGIGGPVLGSVGALFCLLVGAATGSNFWYALASTGFLINMFNMIPISPLDGGRIVGVISRWLWVVGYVVGAGVFWVTKSPILMLVLLMGLFSLGRVIRGPREGYFNVDSSKRMQMGIAYFGLLALMALGMWAADKPLQDMQPEIEAMGYETTESDW